MTGAAPGKVERAADALARRVTRTAGGYVDDKLATLEEQIANDEEELAGINSRFNIAAREQAQALANESLPITERLLIVTSLNATLSALEQRRSTIQEDLLNARQLAHARDQGRAGEGRRAGGRAQDDRPQHPQRRARRRRDRRCCSAARPRCSQIRSWRDGALQLPERFEPQGGRAQPERGEREEGELEPELGVVRRQQEVGERCRNRRPDEGPGSALRRQERHGERACDEDQRR